MKTKKGFTLRTVCGENVLMAEGLDTIDFSKLIRLNSTSAFLWQEAVQQGNFTAESLAQAICREYDVDADKALADTRSMLNRWTEEGLIEA
ncbi:MAG: PqqD family protein [Muribaculaceae bacterium]